jgi:hypothetical protein
MIRRSPHAAPSRPDAGEVGRIRSVVGQPLSSRPSAGPSRRGSRSAAAKSTAVVELEPRPLGRRRRPVFGSHRSLRTRAGGVTRFREAGRQAREAPAVPGRGDRSALPRARPLDPRGRRPRGRSFQGLQSVSHEAPGAGVGELRRPGTQHRPGVEPIPPPPVLALEGHSPSPSGSPGQTDVLRRAGPAASRRDSQVEVGRGAPFVPRDGEQYAWSPSRSATSAGPRWRTRRVALASRRRSPWRWPPASRRRNALVAVTRRDGARLGQLRGQGARAVARPVDRQMPAIRGSWLPGVPGSTESAFSWPPSPHKYRPAASRSGPGCTRRPAGARHLEEALASPLAEA